MSEITKCIHLGDVGLLVILELKVRCIEQYVYNTHSTILYVICHTQTMRLVQFWLNLIYTFYYFTAV